MGRKHRSGPPPVEHREPIVVTPEAPEISERGGDDVVPNVIAELGRSLDFIKRHGLLAAYKAESVNLDRAPDAPHKHQSKFWPEGQATPTSYIKARRQVVPCPRCRRLLLDNGAQSTACTSSGHDVAFFRCRACGHRWKLAVKAF